MLRRLALLGALVSCLTVLVGCIAVQPQPDGTYKLSLIPPGSEATMTAASGGGSTTLEPGSGSSGKSAANSTGKGTPSSPAPPGKTLKSGPWTVLVENTEFPKQLEDGSKPASGKRFLVINVAIKNGGTGNALTVLPSQFALWSPTNKLVDPYRTKLGIYNAQSVRPINAAMGGFTSFVYQVPINSVIYTFTLTPSPKAGTNGSMSWYVP
jgi:hypothetical protein